MTETCAQWSRAMAKVARNNLAFDYGYDPERPWRVMKRGVPFESYGKTLYEAVQDFGSMCEYNDLPWR